MSQNQGASQPDRRSIGYWAGWATVLGVVVAVVAMCVAHNDADVPKTASEAPGSNPSTTPTPTADVSSTPTEAPTRTTPTSLAPPPPAPAIYVDELEYIAYVEIGGVTGSDRRGAEVDGTPYPRSIVVEAGCVIRRNFGTFKLSRKYSRFSATLGVEDNSQDGSKFRFLVFADDKLMYKAELGLGAHRRINISLGSPRPLRLRLEVASLAKDDSPACGYTQYAVFGDAMVSGS